MTDTDDLSARLHSAAAECQEWHGELAELLRDAAVQTNRMRSENSAAIKAIDTLHDQRRALEAERDRLGADTSAAASKFIDWLVVRANEAEQEFDRLRAERIEFAKASMIELPPEQITPAHLREHMQTLGDEADRLRAENEALRKDAERYRWLRKHFDRITACGTSGHVVSLESDAEHYGEDDPKLDAEVDAAIANDRHRLSTEDKSECIRVVRTGNDSWTEL